MGIVPARTAAALAMAGSALLSAALVVVPVAEAAPSRAPAATEARVATAAERARLPRAADLYAVDAATSQVVRFDHLRRGWVTSPVGGDWTDPQRVQVSSRGVVWVLDGGNLVRVARSGERRTVRTFPEGSTDLALDPEGNAYVVDDGQLVRVAASGRRATVLAEVSGVGGPGVDRRGRVTVSSISASRYLDLSTFPAEGGAPTVRHTDVQAPAYLGVLQESVTGAVLQRVPTTGTSGYVAMYRIAPGSLTGTRPTTRLSESVGAFDDRGRLVVAESKTWCSGPAIITGSCTPDYSVERLLVYPARSGTGPKIIPVEGLSVPSGGLAVSERGAVYAADAGIKVVGRRGGTARVLTGGTYRALEVPPGR